MVSYAYIKVNTVKAIFHGINISRMIILVNILDYIFTNLLATVANCFECITLKQCNAHITIHDYIFTKYYFFMKFVKISSREKELLASYGISFTKVQSYTYI